MSHHKIVGVTATYVSVEGSPEAPGVRLIEKTQAWRVCFRGTKRDLGYYIRNANAPDGWKSTDDIDAAIDLPGGEGEPDDDPADILAVEVEQAAGPDATGEDTPV